MLLHNNNSAWHAITRYNRRRGRDAAPVPLLSHTRPGAAPRLCGRSPRRPLRGSEQGGRRARPPASRGPSPAPGPSPPPQTRALTLRRAGVRQALTLLQSRPALARRLPRRARKTTTRRVRGAPGCRWRRRPSRTARPAPGQAQKWFWLAQCPPEKHRPSCSGGQASLLKRGEEPASAPGHLRKWRLRYRQCLQSLLSAGAACCSPQ